MLTYHTVLQLLCKSRDIQYYIITDVTGLIMSNEVIMKGFRLDLKKLLFVTMQRLGK